MDIYTNKFSIAVWDDESESESTLELTAVNDAALAQLVARVNACFGHLLDGHGIMAHGRDLAKRVLYRESLGDHLCPTCASVVMRGDKYCRICGQRLQWEDDCNA